MSASSDVLVVARGDNLIIICKHSRVIREERRRARSVMSPPQPLINITTVPGWHHHCPGFSPCQGLWGAVRESTGGTSFIQTSQQTTQTVLLCCCSHGSVLAGGGLTVRCPDQTWSALSLRCCLPVGNNWNIKHIQLPWLTISQLNSVTVKSPPPIIINNKQTEPQ